MKSVKIAAIVLVTVGLIGFYLNSLIGKSGSGNENYLTETLQKITTKAPLRWVEDSQTSFRIFPEIEKIQDLVDSIGIPKQIKVNTEVAKPDIGNSNPASDASLVGNYYKSFLDALSRVNFTDEESVSLKKDVDTKRALLLEELIELAAGGENLNNLKTSFIAWHQLDERALAELNKISVKPEANYLHRPMIDWFQYHSALAKKFSEENLSAEEIIQLVEEFKNQAEAHNSQFGKSLTALKESPDFVLIPKAEAFTCGALVPPPFYHFGGRVLDMSPCLGGIVEAISPPCGGLIFFSYPILAINPYLYKKPTIGSAVLGKSVMTPGCCLISKEICTPYEATVLYFGTSLVP